jgi:hypothetical protein
MRDGEARRGQARQMQITTNELLLLIEALAMAANQHESQSQFNPRAPYDRKAIAMRKLREKLMKLKAA